MERILLNTHREAVLKLKQTLAARHISLGRKHLVLTPDIYTFTLEKELYQNAGAFDIEVSTFNRQYMRLCESQSVLPQKGAVMLIKKLCLRHRKDLRAYTRSADKNGFAKMLYETFSLLKSSGITPDALLEPAANNPKLHDIRLLFERYTAETEGKYVDAAGRMSALLDYAAAHRPYAGVHMYMILFERPSVLLERLTQCIAAQAASLTVFEVTAQPQYALNCPAEVLSVPDKIVQLKEAAIRIRAAYRDGLSYDDICIVDEGADYDAAARVFTEFGIPFYLERRENLKRSEPAKFMLSAARFCLSGQKRIDALILAKNAYLNIKVDDAARFENFLCAKRLEFVPSVPFTQDGSLALAAAERVRATLYARLSPLFSLKKPYTAKALYAAFVEVFSRAEQVKAAQEGEPADTKNRREEKALGTAALFGEMLGDEPMNADTLIDTLEEGLNSESVAFIPNMSGTVKIGSLDTFRGQSFKFALILNCNEGTFPRVVSDEGLVVDHDIERLKGLGVDIRPTSGERNDTIKKLLKDFLLTQERLYLSYVDAESARPSLFIKLLNSAHPILRRSYFELTTERELNTDENELLRYLAAPAHMREVYYTATSLPYENDLRAAVLRLFPQSLAAEENLEPPLKSAAEIFGRGVSVSALQTFFGCPRRFLFRYGLKLTPRDTGEAKPVDYGNILHKTVEEFMKEGGIDAETHVPPIFDKVLTDFAYEAEKLTPKMKNDLKTEAVTLCRIAADQIAAGSFLPRFFEVNIGGNELPNTMEFEADGRKIQLIGKIDRVDIYENYARVIDYKTGSVGFAYEDIYYGNKLQLAAYLNVLCKNGFSPAGFFFFPFSTSWRDNEYSQRLTGVFLREPTILVALDRALAAGGKSRVIDCNVKLKKDGTLSPYGGRALDRNAMDGILSYTELVARQAVGEIVRGEFPCLPTENGGHRPCEYCEYRGACGYDGEAVRRQGSRTAGEVIAAAQAGAQKA